MKLITTRGRTGPVMVSAIAALMLAVAVTLQWRATQPRPGESPMARGMRLAYLLPASLGGGASRDLPIAETEEMRRAVGQLLNFNDAVFRIYETPVGPVAVYVAWWAPGRMSPRLVAGHTPDVCWPASGWTRDRTAEARHRKGHASLELGGVARGEFRVFVAESSPTYVVFWHKVGEEFVHYGVGGTPPWWTPLAEMWKSGLELRREQLFVRVSAGEPLEEFWQSPAAAPLVAALKGLGLEAAARQ